MEEMYSSFESKKIVKVSYFVISETLQASMYILLNKQCSLFSLAVMINIHDSDIKRLMVIIIVDDWRVDGYRWYQNGTKTIPKHDPKVRKIHFVTVLPTGNDKRFKRLAYFLLDVKCKPTNLLLLHYLGDESIAVSFPHGNSKRNHHHFRTCPSVLAKNDDLGDLPGNVYKSSVARNNCPPKYQPILQPRNLKQIKNVQQGKRQKWRLSHDLLYNLHELAYDLSGFVHTIRTYPDLIIVCGLHTLSTELNQVLMADSPLPQLLSYDTTFQLGDFYLSAFLFRYTLFSSSPVIPAFFLIHERKFQTSHEELMKDVANLVPGLLRGKKKIPLVTDDEVGIHQVRLKLII